jgi:hypothetical protein
MAKLNFDYVLQKVEEEASSSCVMCVLSLCVEYFHVVFFFGSIRVILASK